MTRARTVTALLGILLAAAFGADLLASYDPNERSGPPFARPSADHLLGTDDVGHDLLSLLLHGARISLLVGLSAAAAATVVGVGLGVLAGYARGATDTIAMRGVDVVLALPTLPLAIVVGAFAGPGLGTQIVVIAAVIWAGVAREVRAQVLSLRERDHIQALRAMGASARHVLPRHVLPAVGPLAVPQFVLATKNAIVLEATLAFLGLGDITRASWGTMLSVAYSRSAFLTDAWLWWVVPPGLAIAATVLAFALFGYAVEERGHPALAEGRRRRRPRRPSIRCGGPGPVGAAGPDAGSATWVGEPLPLAIEDLTVGYGRNPADAPVLHGVNLHVRSRQTLGLVGASGCGKTTVAAAVCGLLPAAATVRAGRVLVNGREVTDLTGRQLRALRGAQVALVPQEAMSALNPVHTVTHQLVEAVTAGGGVSRRRARERAADLMRIVGLDPARLGAYPHQLSGGMRQRVVIAIALARDPRLLIADEPTTGLDVLAQAEILDLLASLRDRLGLALLVISHDVAVVARLADRIAVLDGGRVAEHGCAHTLIAAPTHARTRALAQAAGLALPIERLRSADGSGPADRPRSASRTGPLAGGPSAAQKTLLRVDELSVAFDGRGGPPVTALDGVSFEVSAGESVGLVGGSGAGKSTVARVIAGLVEPTAGRVLLDEEVIAAGPAGRHGANGAGTGRERTRRRAVHLVFQDPYAALPPTGTVAGIVAEPLIIHGEACDPAQVRTRVTEALEAVGLTPSASYLQRRPHQLSGGQRQRVAFARAVICRPRLILADEPTAMLDASLRTDIVDVMERLRGSHGTAIVHITHDLALAARSCHRVVVLSAGALVETGPAAAVLDHPSHPYTARLIEAARALHRPRSALASGHQHADEEADRGSARAVHDPIGER